MKKTINNLIVQTLFLFLIISSARAQGYDLKNFPTGYEPEFIASKLVQRYLSSKQGTSKIAYPETCTWFGALRFAAATDDKEMLQQLEDRFTPLLGENSSAMQTPNHVDNTVFGIVPFQLYMQTGNKTYYNIGIDFADRQWVLPENPKTEYRNLAAKGLSWQTRFWIDDMYMITAIQSQAYVASKNEKYINRAAHEMIAYLDSIQRPNGLFYHHETAPFFWCRGNGWMAAGSADLLTYLPEENPNRERIMQEYRKMMATLKSYQNEEGLWRQLIDESDAWTETSGSAMFTYAMAIGLKNGWLDAKEYAPVVRKAWLALVGYLNEDWALREVCIGTNIGYTKQYYMDRGRPTGDLHGQAALLWCAVALYDTENNSRASLSSLFYDNGTLTPAFNPEITAYTCNLPNGINTVIPRLAVSYGTTVNAEETVNLSSGTGVSTITVTSMDGKNTKTYTINFVTGNDVNCTNLIVNNDFDLAPDANCNPVQVGPGINGWDTSGIPAWRLSKSSCSSKQFYGWTHNQSLLGTSTSQGINADGENKHGNWVCWIGGNKTGYTEFEFSQTIDKAKLTAGTYKVQCLLAVGKGDKKNNQRLFVNNKVQYFGNPSHYKANLVQGEEYTFAGYSEFSETNLQEMVVYATINSNESLKIGIRTSNKEGDGDITSTQKSPMFKLDYFRLTKIDPVVASDATLANITLSAGELNFFSNQYTYNITLPKGTNFVKPIATGKIQDVNIAGIEDVDVSSGSGVSTITVTALDGITTKTYTINYTVNNTSGFNNATLSSVSWSVNNGKLTIKGADAYQVYNIKGVKIADVKMSTLNKEISLTPGFYIVKIKDSEPFKVIVK